MRVINVQVVTRTDTDQILAVCATGDEAEAFFQSYPEPWALHFADVPMYCPQETWVPQQRRLAADKR